MTDRDIFTAAREMADPAVRSAYLDGTCAGDRALRDRVESLLRAHDQPCSGLDAPPIAPPGHGATRTYAPHTDTEAYRDGVDGPGRPDDEPFTFLSPSARPDALGRIGHYDVLQVVGRGAFGIVFRAVDNVLQRVVAVKVMAPQLAATSPARKRFLREARTSAQVRHENVVQVYEVAEQPLPYLAMEFIPGETLQHKLDRTGPIDASEVVRTGRQIAEGLAAAHATGLIHRDIKPANVLIEDGAQLRVKITDFGLARAADDASISQSGIIAGTPMYMAPEQALGHKLDQRADLFSLGSVLYQMVAGRAPFRANSTVAVLRRVTEDTPRDIREIVPETPQWLCDFIAKLHAKDPDERYQSAREVADVLADCEAQLGTSAGLKDFSRFPRGKPRGGKSGRRKWVAAAAVLLLSAVALAVTESAGVTHLFRGRQAATASNWTDGEPTPTRVAKEPPRAVAPFDAAQAKEYQNAWARYLGVETEEITNSIGMKLRLIPPGEFQMGSSPEQIQRILKHVSEYGVSSVKREGPVHLVRIDKACYLGMCEVTVGQFRKFVEETGYKTLPETNGVGSIGFKDGKAQVSKEFTWRNPKLTTSENLPVVCIDFEDAQAFCEWLSRTDRRRYEIPHESVLEFACRAGTTELWYWGDSPEGWERFMRPGINPVASMPANAFGLYDMIGNVKEFARTESYMFTFRGGGEGWNVWHTRSGSRDVIFDKDNPFKSGHSGGFRVAIVGDLTPPAKK